MDFRAEFVQLLIIHKSFYHSPAHLLLAAQEQNRSNFWTQETTVLQKISIYTDTAEYLQSSLCRTANTSGAGPVKDEAIRRWSLSGWLPHPWQLSLTTTWKGCESHSTKIHLSTLSGWWSFNLGLSAVTRERQSHRTIFHYKVWAPRLDSAWVAFN